MSEEEEFDKPIIKVCSRCGQEYTPDGAHSWCRVCYMLYLKKKYSELTEEQLSKRRQNANDYYLKNRTKCIERTRARRKVLRMKVLQHYSHSQKPYCNNCGEDDLLVLCLDHIKGGGTKETKRGESFHLMLIKQGYPDGFQILCANCNQRKRMLKETPHVFKYPKQ